MSELTLESLAKRIEELERRMAEQLAAPRVKDWRRSVGLYVDPVIAMQIDAEGAAIRQAERDEARREGGE